MDGTAQFEERLARPYTVEVKGDEPGSFEGMGAVFNDLHPTSSWRLPPEWSDRILPGAFARTLKEHERLGSKPAMLFQHERGNICGAWDSIGEVGAGLHVAGRVAMSACVGPGGAQLYELMRMGGLRCMSIGFDVTKANLDEKKKIRDIVELDLGEVSLVDIGGIPRALMTDVKRARDSRSFLAALEEVLRDAHAKDRDPKNIRFIEAVLREAGRSKTEAKERIAALGLTALRDAGAGDPARRDAAPVDGDGDDVLERLLSHLKGAVKTNT